jgi:glycosyltransferase involved in cell wall biosynthesis
MNEPEALRNVAAGGTAPVSAVDWPRECGVVIPCLDEAKSIGSLVRAVRQQLPMVVVVDDGSTDGTASAATAAGAHVLRHEAREGKGAALRTGLTWLHQHGFSWALLMDGDGQHAAEDIPLFLEDAARTGSNLLVGNRMINPGAMPWVRRVTNHWMSARLSRLSGHMLPDSQCGFRLMQLAAWEGLELTTSHFEIESELLLAFLDAGFAVRFVAVRAIYGNERTKISAGSDGWRWLAWLWRVRRARKSVSRQKPLHSTAASSTLAV